jgi:hypothetical protein
MLWRVVPRSARSAMISPITLANLNPRPEHGEANDTSGWSGCRSMTKWLSRVQGLGKVPECRFHGF